jgi:thiol-disulfide isomerase/thioredoxin
MKRTRNRFYLTIITLVSFNGFLFSQGYNIKLNAPDFSGQEVILVEYVANKMIPKDTAQINLLGEAEFSGDEAFDGGLYVIYFNSEYHFDFLLDTDQFFTVTTDSSDFVSNTHFEGSEDNSLFYDYKKFLGTKRILQNKYLEDLSEAKTKSDSSLVNKKIKKLRKEIDDHIVALIEKNRPSMFSTFFQSMQDVKPPEDILTGTKRQNDSISYFYTKDHYFDNFDFTDIRLLHTPLIDSKVKHYINNIVPQHLDSLIVAIDFLIEKSRADDAIFRFMLVTLFNNFAESKLMGMDKVYFHLAENYYIPEATWSSAEFIDKLKDKLKKNKPTFIGKIAPDFELKGVSKDHFIIADMDTVIKNDPHVGFNFTLSSISAEYTILYFWEADCGHCKKSTPILYEVFNKYKNQGVKVLAVHVINSVEGKVKWVDFVNEHEMLDWINCWSPYSNDFRKDYNLLSFPKLYLLDKDKKIVAKGLSPEQVDEILDNLLNK